MNPFERINELKQVIFGEIKSAGINKNFAGKSMTEAEHYKRMLNMLNILETEMGEAEYHYEVEALDHSVMTFEEHTVFQKELNNNVIIFQPINVGEDEISMLDMESLSNILVKLRDSGEIEENIIILPPNVNVFRAKLARPEKKM